MIDTDTETPHNYWLWITNRGTASGLIQNSKDFWTCDRDTKKGDLILLYLNSKGEAVKGYPKSAFCYLIQATGSARNGEHNPGWSENGWKDGCDARVLYVFKNPVRYQELKIDPLFQKWDAYKKHNFQGRSFPIPENIWNKLDNMAMDRNPEYHGYRDFLATQGGSSDLTNGFKASEYVYAFQNLVIAPHYRKMLRFNYFAPNRTLTATEMAKAMGYDHYTAANLHYGKLGRMVGEKLGLNPLPKYKVNVLVDFEKPEAEWTWIMKPAIAEAIELLGWNEDASTNPDEVVVNENNKPIYEGAMRKVSVNAYERSSIARTKCLLHYGCQCAACGVILSNIYGEIAQGYIHVHHLSQLAEVNSEYQIDPIADLRPVCPTCHSIIHLGKNTPSGKAPYSIEEVRELIKSQRSI